MKRILLTVVALAGWTASAACSSSSGSPSSDIDNNGHSGSSGGSGSGSGSGDSGSGSGSSGDGGSGSTSPDGSVADGGTPSDSGEHEIPDAFPDVNVTVGTDAAMVDATCKMSMNWSAPTAVPGVAVFATATPPLVTMTNDELTIVWVIAGSGGAGTVYLADRATTSDSFGSPTVITGFTTGTVTSPYDGGPAPDGGDTYFAFERVAVSPDGLTLTGVALGDQHLAQLTRLARPGTTFEAPTEAFEKPLAASLMTQFGEKLGDLVVGPNALDLIYSRYGDSQTTVYESTRTMISANWEPGAPRAVALTESMNGLRKHPSSLTADKLTLFIWDDSTNAGAYILRPTVTADFNYTVPLGAAYYSPQINGPCTRLYYVTSSGANQYQLVQSDGS